MSEDQMKRCDKCGNLFRYPPSDNKDNKSLCAYCDTSPAPAQPEGEQRPVTFDWTSWEAQAVKFCDAECYARVPRPTPTEWDILALLQDRNRRATTPPDIPSNAAMRAAREIASRPSHMPPEASLARMKAAFELDCIEIERIITRHLAATPIVAREVYSELIHIAAELVKGEGFLSPCAEDHSARTPKGVIAAAQYQDCALKDWANRIRQVADRLSAATTSPSSEPALPDRFIELFRDTAIKCHIGFKHKGPWDECEWIECEERRKLIAATTSPSETAVGGEARTCVLCSHDVGVDKNGICNGYVIASGSNFLPCLCKCEFAAPVSPAVDDEKKHGAI